MAPLRPTRVQLSGTKSSALNPPRFPSRSNPLVCYVSAPFVWMPEMTGYELLKKVKGSTELKEIPVVIMSSENIPTRITKCLEEGAEDFLLKPVRSSDVQRVCSRMMMR